MEIAPQIDPRIEPTGFHTVPGTPKILVIRPRKIGDMVLMTPLLRTLRRAYPSGTLIALAQRPCDEVLVNNPHLNGVWPYPADGCFGEYLALARRVRRMEFDIVIDALGTPATARLTRISRARQRIGLRLPGRAWAYTDRVPLPAPGTYAGLAQSRLLAPLGLEVDSLRTEMFPGPPDWDYAGRVLHNLGWGQDGVPLIGIGPTVAQTFKRWPAADYARLADALMNRWGARILFFAGPGEESTVAAVRAAMRNPTPTAAPVTHTLAQLAALLARCDLFIGNDTGTRHIAIAMGVSTVGIFGKSRPAAWTPPGDPRHRTAANDPGCKSRCTYPRCATLPCIREITPHDVLRHVEALLAGLASGGQDIDSAASAAD